MKNGRSDSINRSEPILGLYVVLGRKYVGRYEERRKED